MMFSSLLVVACLTAPHATPVDAIENWRALYAQGVAFRTFLDAADERRQAWHDNYRLGVVPETLQSRARAVPGRWHVLVVAEDWCGDSVNTVPYLARLVERLDRVDLRVVDSDMGRPVMESHRTPDGRPATPTVVLLNDEFEEAGCFVERPAVLQSWYLENQGTLGERELYRQKYAWYDRDAGSETLREFVELLERAASGAGGCRH